MKKQLGFINIPSWVFLMSFVGIILVLVELVRLVNSAMWSRRRYELQTIGFAPSDVSGVRAVVVGHTPLKSPTWVGNVFHIDTGACFHWGRFSFVDAKNLEVWA